MQPQKIATRRATAPESRRSGSLADTIFALGSEHPTRTALVSSEAGCLGTYETLSYAAFVRRVQSFATALAAAGVRPGSRVLMLAPQSMDLCAIVVALIRSGIVAVFVDGSMPRRRVLQTVARASVDAVIGVRRTLRWWPLIRGMRGVTRLSLDGPGHGFDWLTTSARGTTPSRAVRTPEIDDLAVLSFTSGSTGRAKGVERTHGVLEAQHRFLEQAFPVEPGEITMSFFPLVVMHNLACGKTSVLTHPVGDRLTEQRASEIISVIRCRGVTTLCGPPRVIDGLIRCLDSRGERLRSVGRLVVGGAPVTASLARRVLDAFPLARAHVLYGATEAEPITCAAMEEVAHGRHDGFFVGRPVPGVRVSLLDDSGRSRELALRDGNLRLQPTGVVGEVLVSGPHVSGGYFRDHEANSHAKLVAADGAVWHRTGDVARLEADRSLTLLGRVSDVVPRSNGRFHPYPVEAAIHELMGVHAAAFVGHARAPEGEVAIQLESNASADTIDAVRSVLRSRGLPGVVVRLVTRMPMDRRHRSKVDRPVLRRLLAARRY